MIESTNLFAEKGARPSFDINDDLEEDNSDDQDQDENLNQMTDDFAEKQLTAPQKPEIQISEPQTENDLIADIRNLNQGLNFSTLVTYWGIGQKINAFYKGKYGANELQRIADGADVGKDTLAKACKFARIYSHDQLEILIRGSFYLSWFQISQNLAVEPRKLIDVYQSVHSPDEFYNGIIKLKDPGESRGKAVRKVKTGENVGFVAAVESSGFPDRNDAHLPESCVYYDVPEELPFHDQVIDVMAEPADPKVDQAYESYRLELESVKSENQALKRKLDQQGENYIELDRQFGQCSKELDRMLTIGRQYQEILKKIVDMCEDGNSPQTLFDLLTNHEITPYWTGRLFKV
jgi:hypothetical protein